MPLSYGRGFLVPAHIVKIIQRAGIGDATIVIVPTAPEHRAKALTVINLKGGVGKTHTVWLLAGVCEERGQARPRHRHGHAGQYHAELPSAGAVPSSRRRGPLRSPHRHRPENPHPPHAVCRTSTCFPSSAVLAAYDLSDQRQWERSDLHFSLAEGLRTIRDSYDYLVFDCPPRLSLVSFAALCASDYVMIPLEAADWGAQGIVQVTAAVNHARGTLQPAAASPRLPRLPLQAQPLVPAQLHGGTPQALRPLSPLTPSSRIWQATRSPSRIVSQSPSTLRPATKLASPARSSTKSSGASGKLVEAALSKADQTFTSSPALPLPDDSPPPASLEGRRRLGGAFAIARDRIRPDPNQPRRRFDTEAQKELNDSVQRLGILQPITVRFIEADGIYQVIAGERRYHAACEAGTRARFPAGCRSRRSRTCSCTRSSRTGSGSTCTPTILPMPWRDCGTPTATRSGTSPGRPGNPRGKSPSSSPSSTSHPAVQKVAREDHGRPLHPPSPLRDPCAPGRGADSPRRAHAEGNRDSGTDGAVRCRTHAGHQGEETPRRLR